MTVQLSVSMIQVFAGRSGKNTDCLIARTRLQTLFLPFAFILVSYHRLAYSYRTLILLLGREEQRSSVTEYPLPGSFQPSV